MQKRRRFKQTDLLEERLTHEANRLREQAERMKPGPKREAILRQIQQAEIGAHMSEWLRSPGLQPPK